VYWGRCIVYWGSFLYMVYLLSYGFYGELVDYWLVVKDRERGMMNELAVVAYHWYRDMNWGVVTDYGHVRYGL
jgi:hypothetical protein